MKKSIIGWGLVAGAAGVVAMTLAETLEQLLTGRPNSYVPAHTAERLFGLEHRPDRGRVGLHWAMHLGQGLLGGVVRAWMASRGIRGPVMSFMNTAMRLTLDQTLENATGVGAPPWTWPRDEQWIDLAHKALYAYAAGAVAERLIPAPQAGRPARSPADGWGWAHERP
ncbi:MAG TPA: hypothetical protein VH877_07505 [Polyangia bacterium]|jgi:hypothetical protein|nr:hypothetical protein [Polyangia bacterium]